MGDSAMRFLFPTIAPGLIDQRDGKSSSPAPSAAPAPVASLGGSTPSTPASPASSSGTLTAVRSMGALGSQSYTATSGVLAQPAQAKKRTLGSSLI